MGIYNLADCVHCKVKIEALGKAFDENMKIEHGHLQFSEFTGQVQEIRYIGIEEISIMIDCKSI